MTSQIHFEFDCLGGQCRICLIEPITKLLENIDNIMLDLDEKYRLMDRPEGARLLMPEREALLFAVRFYPATNCHPKNS